MVIKEPHHKLKGLYSLIMNRMRHLSVRFATDLAILTVAFILANLVLTPVCTTASALPQTSKIHDLNYESIGASRQATSEDPSNGQSNRLSPNVEQQNNSWTMDQLVLEVDSTECVVLPDIDGTLSALKNLSGSAKSNQCINDSDCSIDDGQTQHKVDTVEEPILTSTYSETTFVSLGSLPPLVLDESFTISTSLIKDTGRQLSESCTGSDSLINRLAKELAEDWTAADMALKHFIQENSETITASAELERKVTYLKGLRESMSLDDEFDRRAEYFREYTENCPVNDS
ncbi:hypothetical protein ACFLXE_03965, partial [Chloroflexota bacterium]